MFQMTEKARFDPKYFPYDALMEYEHYAGKYCKRYTTEKPTKKRKPKLNEGQLTMEQLVRFSGVDYAEGKDVEINQIAR